MDSVIIAFESVQISHTQPFPNLLRFKSFPRKVVSCYLHHEKTGVTALTARHAET